MREIVLDTETTGFEPAEGDRIVEIGAVELFNHVPDRPDLSPVHQPAAAMPQGAFEVHGLGDDFLRDKPVFAQIAEAFLDFIGMRVLVIHNAAFDMKFLNAELSLAQPPAAAAGPRHRYAGHRPAEVSGLAQASLDALCRRFGIDNSAHPARRASGQRDSGRGLSGTDRRTAARSGPVGASHGYRSRRNPIATHWRPYPRPAPAAAPGSPRPRPSRPCRLHRGQAGRRCPLWSRTD
jgi:DNA polymerase III subunit epsilon